LELGGNNAIIVTPDADIKMTVIGAVLELWELLDKDVLQPVV
jgi:acyl-CoA reductase-like NAD-dependent aldehyde dehydrogenase